MSMKTTGNKPIYLIDYAESLQRKGRYFFSKQEAMDALGISSSAFGKAANRLSQSTKIMRVKNNFYAVVPPEYRDSKGLPPTFFIDHLMKFIGQPYYVGVLSAAALHGAAHQSPQELQVVTTKRLLNLEHQNSRVRFLNKKRMENTFVETKKTPMGSLRVSTPEATALDLLRYVRFAGHLDNVATVLIELSEVMQARKLMEAAKADNELSYAQRLGYLLDRFVSTKLTEPLHTWLSKQNPSPVFLRADQRKGVTERDNKWQVMVNTEVDPDL
ncbi:MAG: type IV toxin-antitoxin system AbiEi family antitoxin [Bdellovibrionaceae bacterium]|nr:type IV toxin-antitoxin system AbiEi family antitoxin [Pseudobdellovibrionaceae bacterium]